MFTEGQQIGPYTLLRKLGKGGFGEVWLAERRSQFLTKKVAVKLPHDEQINFETIQREAGLWEEASGHPNVLPIIDADVYDGQVAIVSEYADGGSLADRLTSIGTISHKNAIELTIGILSGLEFLHGKRIIHRDIKPQNILLQGDTPRLADFGISRAMQTTAISSTIIGTDAYMSPEAFDGKRSVQTDIWSTGVLLYQLLNGSLPFPQEHPSERMFAVLTKEFTPLQDDIPSDLKQIVQTALAKLPEDRYQSAAAMRDDLAKALNSINNPTHAKTEVLNISSMATEPAVSPTYDPEATVVKRSDPPAPPASQAPVPFVADDSVVTRVEVSIPQGDLSPIAADQPRSEDMSMGKIILVAGGLVFLALLASVIFSGLTQPGSRTTVSNSSNSSGYVTNTFEAMNANRAAANAMANANRPMNTAVNTSTSSNTGSSNTKHFTGTTFCEGYSDGWKEGWKRAKEDGSTPPPVPTCKRSGGSYDSGLYTGVLHGSLKARGRSFDPIQ